MHSTRNKNKNRLKDKNFLTTGDLKVTHAGLWKEPKVNINVWTIDGGILYKEKN